MEPLNDNGALKELVQSPHQETHVFVAIQGNAIINLMNIIDCERFSDFNFLLRVTACVLHFVEMIRGRPLKILSICYTSSAIEAAKLNRAETLWIRSIQTQLFKNEIRYLKGGSSQSKPPYIVYSLTIKVSRERINNASLSATEKIPVMFPSKHPFVSCW